MVYATETIEAQPTNDVTTSSSVLSVNFERISSPVVGREGGEDLILLSLSAKTITELEVQRPLSIDLNLPYLPDEMISIRLHQVKLLHDNAHLITPTTDYPELLRSRASLFYQGTLPDNPNAFVFLTLHDGAILLDVDQEEKDNYKVYPYENGDTYLLESISEFSKTLPFVCDMPDLPTRYPLSTFFKKVAIRSSERSELQIYLEIDYDVYAFFNNLRATERFVLHAFNEMHQLFLREHLELTLSDLFVWTQPSPYDGKDNATILKQFQEYRTVFQGDLAQLFSLKASGGLAASFAGLCHPDRSQSMAYVGLKKINIQEINLKTTVISTSHEIGHLLGSRHTHACVWNSNNTAIDACPGYVEGSCSPPTLAEAELGTIMSYCHLQDGGIDLSNGFGLQPGNVLRYTVLQRRCQPASAEKYDLDCDQGLIIKLFPDNYGSETTWALSDEDGHLLLSGGPYHNGRYTEPFVDTICLPLGCYDFTIRDKFRDGICCKYGPGFYELMDLEGTLLASGGEFEAEETQHICLTQRTEDPALICTSIDLGETPIQIHNNKSPEENYTFQQSNTVLRANQDALFELKMEEALDSNSLLVFQFGVLRVGALHSIEVLGDKARHIFNLCGNQIEDALYTSVGKWQEISLPIGTFLDGQLTGIVIRTYDQNSYFKAFEIVHPNICGEKPQEYIQHPILQYDLPYSSSNTPIVIYPNPTESWISVQVNKNLPFNQSSARWRLIDMQGRILRSAAYVPGMQLDIANLPAGIYNFLIMDGINSYSALLQKVEKE